MAAPLNNGLAELLVVVGMDRHTGLVASNPQVQQACVLSSSFRILRLILQWILHLCIHYCYN